MYNLKVWLRRLIKIHKEVPAAKVYVIMKQKLAQNDSRVKEEGSIRIR